MVYKKVNNGWMIRLETGEEIITSLTGFCIEKQINTGFISGIGAIDYAKLGFFDMKTKQYIMKEFTEDMEITSLLGNISQKEGKPFLHLHINCANREFYMFGGHLFIAKISATCEIILEVIDKVICRKYHSETELFLLDI